MDRIYILLVVSCLSVCLSKSASAATSPWKKYDLTPRVDQGYNPDNKTDEGGLWMASGKMEEATRQSPFLVKDDALNKKVRQMTCDIAGEYCEDIRVYILRNPQFNATMFPNGMMHLWTGLLLRVDNEAQLAAVIGHEVGHYLRNHSLKRWKSVKAQTGAAAWVSFISIGAGAGAVGDIFSLGVLANILSYSRAHESEADAYGLQLLAKAGYDPHQARLVWDYIERENKSAKNPRKGSIFSDSHPSPKNRKKALEKLADALQPQETNYKVGDKTYQAMLGPHYHELISAEIKRKLYGRMETLLNHLGSRNNATLPMDYYWGLFYRGRKQDGDRELALRHYQMAVEAGNAPPEAHRDLGYMLLKAKDIGAAKKYFSSYLELQPDASDKEMVQFYLNADS